MTIGQVQLLLIGWTSPIPGTEFEPKTKQILDRANQ